MNLTDREKKLLSNAAMILGAILIIGLSYWGATSLLSSYKEAVAKSKQVIIEKYETRIDSLRIVNKMLTYQVDSLDKEILTIKKQKEYVYIYKTLTDKVIKDASMSEHAKELDVLTSQEPTWAIVKDSVTKDTTVKYIFTKTGIVNLRLNFNNLKQYQRLYQLDEQIIAKQDAEINLQKIVIANNVMALESGNSALTISKTENDKLTKQLNKAEKRAGRWPYWLGAGVIGGMAACLLVQ